MTLRIILRGVDALLGEDLTHDRSPLDVTIEHGHIASIGPAGTAEGSEVIELPNRLLVPGLINGHQHSHEHFHKGRTENLPLELWMPIVRSGLAVPLTPRQAYLRTLIGAIEAVRSGTTTLVDDLIVGGVIDRAIIDAVFQAYEDIGMRALVGFAMTDRPIVETFPFAEESFPAELFAQLRAAPSPGADAYLDLCRQLVRDRHPQSRRVGMLVSASAPQRCTPEFLSACRRFADDHGLPVISHVQETRLQVVTGNVFFGKPMVEYLDRIGFLAPRTSLIHVVWLNPREVEVLARTGTTAQHNPWSNLTLGSGVQPVRALLDGGVNVSLGSDGTCSTLTANMLTVLGNAAALSKLRGDDYRCWLSAREVLIAATQGGAKALGFEGKLGVIKPGAIADLTAVRFDSLPFVPLHDAVRQLVYAERGAGVDFSMVAGRVIMRDGALVDLNESALLEEIAEAYSDLAPKYALAEESLGPILQTMERIYQRCLKLPIAKDTYPARFA